MKEKQRDVPQTSPLAGYSLPSDQLSNQFVEIISVIHRNQTKPVWCIQTSNLLSDSFLRLSNFLGCDLLLECGAHNAETSRRFVSMGIGNAIAIEANPHTFETLTASSQGAGVVALPFGLGSKVGEMILQIPLDSGTKIPGNASFLSRENDTRCLEIPVPMTTVDRILIDASPFTSIALWIDVEGMSAEVLLGAKDSLEKGEIALIHVEVETHSYWKGQSLLNEVDEFLRTHSFRPILRDFQTETQFNVIYVHTRNLQEIDSICREYWTRLTALRARAFLRKDWTFRDSLRSIKLGLVNRPDLTRTKVLHHIAAALGSRSSRQWLKSSEKLKVFSQDEIGEQPN